MKPRQAPPPLYQLTFFYPSGLPKIRFDIQYHDQAQVVAFTPLGTIDKIINLTLDELEKEIRKLRPRGTRVTPET